MVHNQHLQPSAKILLLYKRHYNCSNCCFRYKTVKTLIGKHQAFKLIVVNVHEKYKFRMIKDTKYFVLCSCYRHYMHVHIYYFPVQKLFFMVFVFVIFGVLICPFQLVVVCSR